MITIRKIKRYLATFINLRKHKKWQNGMYAKYPIIFGDHSKPMNQTCMCWGIAINKGWYGIVEELCENINSIVGNTEFKVIADQVKEKFGGLRFYWHAEFPEWMSKEDGGKIDDMIMDIISKAELKSEVTCEVCGRDGVKTKKNGWVTTLCKRHSRRTNV